MEKITKRFDNVYDVAGIVYTKASDAYTYAYADKECTTKILTADLLDAFRNGLIIVDAASDIEYLPVSCAVASNIATVTYVTTDGTTGTTATTAKLATVKSVAKLPD